MTSFKYFTALAISLLTFACVRHSDVFQYISMKSDGNLEQISTGTIDNSKVKLEHEIILEYRLDRELYDIKFAIDPSGLMPNIVVSIDSTDTSSELKLIPKRFRKNAKSDIPQCDLSYIVQKDTSFQVVVPKCFEITEENYISFDVVIDNIIVGNEDLSFVIKESGMYETLDGI